MIPAVPRPVLAPLRLSALAKDLPLPVHDHGRCTVIFYLSLEVDAGRLGLWPSVALYYHDFQAQLARTGSRTGIGDPPFCLALV